MVKFLAMTASQPACLVLAGSKHPIRFIRSKFNRGAFCNCTATGSKSIIVQLLGTDNWPIDNQPMPYRCISSNCLDFVKQSFRNVSTK